AGHLYLLFNFPPGTHSPTVVLRNGSWAAQLLQSHQGSLSYFPTQHKVDSHLIFGPWCFSGPWNGCLPSSISEIPHPHLPGFPEVCAPLTHA
ncbi:unnamed protein product, partial [Rangifer tarandus platyrhynchus]